jgi:hypothetical protein
VASGAAPAGLWVLAGALVALYAGSALRNHDQEELHG